MNTIPYYEENYEKIFNAVEHPNWRVWKLIDEDGTCRQNKTQITAPKRLLKFIKLAKNPKALYVSVSTFLNPHKNHGFFFGQKKSTGAGNYFYPREGYVCADCILLDSYFFVDLDHPSDLSLPRQDAVKVIEHMDLRHNFQLHSIQFSGTKGYHLVYKRKTDYISDPIYRIRCIQAENELLADNLLDLGLKTIDRNHLNIMKDVFRVYAAPYSIKLNGGVVQPLSRSSLWDLTSEAKADESKVALARVNALAPHTDREKQRAGLSSSPIFYKFVDNSVKGTRRNYVTVIKQTKTRLNVEKLRKLQEVYGLSDFHIVELGDFVYAYNFKLLQFKRLVKVLRAAKSENLSLLLSKGHLPLIISDAKTSQKSTLHRLRYLGTLKSKHGKTSPHSRSHCELFSTHYENMVGSPYNGKCCMGVAI